MAPKRDDHRPRERVEKWERVVYPAVLRPIEIVRETTSDMKPNNR